MPEHGEGLLAVKSVASGRPEHMLGSCPRLPEQPRSRCDAVSPPYLVDGIMRDSVLVIFPLGGSFSTNTSGVGSSASWTSACWLDSCKNTGIQVSRNKPIPLSHYHKGWQETPQLSSSWGTLSLLLPDTPLTARKPDTGYLGLPVPSSASGGSWR